MEESEQQNLAIMLMVVVIIFVLCNVLAMVSNILDAIDYNALHAQALTQVGINPSDIHYISMLLTVLSKIMLFKRT